ALCAAGSPWRSYRSPVPATGRTTAGRSRAMRRTPAPPPASGSNRSPVRPSVRPATGRPGKPRASQPGPRLELQCVGRLVPALVAPCDRYHDLAGPCVDGHVCARPGAQGASQLAAEELLEVGRREAVAGLGPACLRIVDGRVVADVGRRH